MRVICFSTGHAEYTIQLANALSKKESVMLIFPRSAAEGYLDRIDQNVDLFLFGPKRNPPLAKKYLFYVTLPLTLWGIVKHINKFKPDVVHIQGAFHPWACFFIPFIKKYPLVGTLHVPRTHIGQYSEDWNRCFREANNWCGAKYSDQIIVLGEKLKERTMDVYNLPSDKVNAIPIGDDSEQFKIYERKALKEEGNLILFFGSIWEYKGVRYLIEAEPLITKEVPDAKIIIAGRGEDFSKYERMMVNKDNFIVYNEYVSNEKVAEIFQRCSVVALPYIDASQSDIISVAYRFKKPVVVTDVGALPEIVDEGKTGFIVPSRNPKALAEAIVKLLNDEKLRKQMGENAYKKLKANLSWDIIAEQTIKVYRRALSDRG